MLNVLSSWHTFCDGVTRRQVLHLGRLLLLGSLCGGILDASVSSVAGADAIPQPTQAAPFGVVDLSIGESLPVTLANGKSVMVKLLELNEQRDAIRGAVRRAEVKVEVGGQTITLVSANYRLPQDVGGVRIDCPITAGYAKKSSRTSAGHTPWGLTKDARIRVWPADGPLIEPLSFRYPARQRWFASATQMANEPVYVDGGERPSTGPVYYHYGLDIGGAEGHVDVIAATDGLIVSVGKEVLPGYQGTPVAPRYDVVYVLDDRGWYYRYSHLHTIGAELQIGKRIKLGQPIGILGKEGGSGGWSHLHFDISGRQPSGEWGIIDGYVFLWDAYRREFQPPLIAVARPHHFATTGERVVLDGSRSWSSAGPIEKFEWVATDGQRAAGAQWERTYSKPGVYSETLQVTDKEGRVDFDFAIVHVLDREHPEQLPPSIHASFTPTFGLRPTQPVRFFVRTFRTTDGEETWDFGDDTPPVKVQSDGNVTPLAKDGYAITEHRYAKPGTYLVNVRRTDRNGATAVARLKVVVEK